MSKLTLTGFNAEYIIRDRRLTILTPVIEQWLRINREFIEEGEYEDAMYIYNERSTISSLAGAVWRCGGYAQEEYSASKGEGEEKTNGRIDLFFNFSHKNIIVEAKKLWIYLYENNKKNIKNHIQNSLDEATLDIQKTIAANHYGDFNMAVTFVVPYWSKETNQENNLKLIKKIVKEIDSSMYIIFESTAKDVEIEDEDIYNICIAIFKDIK